MSIHLAEYPFIHVLYFTLCLNGTAGDVHLSGLSTYIGLTVI